MTSLISLFLSVTSTDWMIAFGGFLTILLFLLTVELGIKYANISRLYTRKFIHIITGLILCIVAYFIQSNIPLLLFSLLYLLIDLYSLRKGKFKSIHPDSHSMGTLFYAISVFVLALLFWDVRKPLFIITNLIMILPDALAALIGEKFAKEYFIPLTEKKSVIGAITMFLLTVTIVCIGILHFYTLTLPEGILISVTLGIIATVSELLSVRGSDNLSVPMFSGLYLYAFIVRADESDFILLVVGTLASASIAFISYKMKFLDNGGALLVIIMGGIILGFGGLAYAVPILLFFVLSSILSTVSTDKKKSIEVTYQKSGTRDFYQVFANGGIATLLVLIQFFSGNDILYAAYIVALAAATADTWGTELGIYSRKQPVLISTLKSVEPGTSGGISLIGSLASFSGSLLIVLSAVIFYKLGSMTILLMICCGYFGSVIDSFLGATVQSQYRCRICEKITENAIHCQQSAILIHGKRRIDNDIVNILSILITTVLFLLLNSLKEIV